jgi:hypothetical protein
MGREEPEAGVPWWVPELNLDLGTVRFSSPRQARCLSFAERQQHLMANADIRGDSLFWDTVVFIFMSFL